MNTVDVPATVTLESVNSVTFTQDTDGNIILHCPQSGETHSILSQAVTGLMVLCFMLYVLVWFGHADGEDLGSDGTTEPFHKRLRLSDEDEDAQDSTSAEYSVVTLPSEYKHTCTCLYTVYIFKWLL